MPHVVPYYACDICNTAYSREEQAVRCEAAKPLEPLSWLPLGVKIPRFTSHHCTWVIATELFVGNGVIDCSWPGAHVWTVCVQVWQPEDDTWYDTRMEANDLDPRRMHWCYVPPDGEDRHEFQQRWLTRYGLELPKATVSYEAYMADSAETTYERAKLEGPIMILGEDGKYYDILWPMGRD